jgi:transposase
VTLTTADLDALLGRVHQSNLAPVDAGMVDQVCRSYAWVMLAIEKGRFTMKQLRRLLLGSSRPVKEAAGSETLSPSHEQASLGDDGDEPTRIDEAHPSGEASGGEVDSNPAASSHKAKGGHRSGTGRLGADAYVGAERTECRHEELAVGQRCPVCGQGTLYALPPGHEIRIDGHALLSAMHYELEKLRCSACGEIFTASLPPEVGPDKYSARARAVLVVSRYYLGLPFYRLEGYQAMMGVPVPDSTQWDQIEKVGDCCYVVFEHLEFLAAQGELIYQDDTSVRIVTLIKENRAIEARAAAQGLSRPKERTGMFTTALVVKVGEQTICLYYSSRAHAGENLESLLRQRQEDQAPPLVMSDALSRNEVGQPGVIRCHCLAHGRRQFSDLEEVFPQACQVVLDVLSEVFDHDEQARKENMSPAERLAYHQALSRPLMDELKVWLDRQIDDRLGEPNSALGQAIAYMQNHWMTLTRFLAVPGAPLDNNLVERVLKLFIRQRKNSLFYKTEYSAYVASMLTSLIVTCIYAGINVLDYLEALQEHRAEVFTDPSAWLLWTFEASLAPP